MSNQFDVVAFREELQRMGDAFAKDARAAARAFAEALSGTGLKSAAPNPEEPAETRMWQFAIRVPEGREGELTRLINESGAEVYRAWPVGEENR